ncbi:MAG: carbon storage regulator [Candidatus Pacearchaeota archaeon]
MLVLTRGRNQSILIGNIELIVKDIRKDEVMIEIDYPSNISVYRIEIYQSLEEQRLEKEFTSYLNKEDYEKAFDIFYECRGIIGTRSEIEKMISGLKNINYKNNKK